MLFFVPECVRLGMLTLIGLREGKRDERHRMVCGELGTQWKGRGRRVVVLVAGEGSQRGR